MKKRNKKSNNTTINLLYAGLAGSLAIGIYYMGRKQIYNDLVEKGYATIDDKSNYVLTKKGEEQKVVTSGSIIDTSKKMDYTKVIPVYDEEGNLSYVESTADGNAFNYNDTKYHINLNNTALKLNKDGEIEPTAISGIIEGVKSVFLGIKKVVMPF